MNFKNYLEITMSAGQLFFTMPYFSKAIHVGDMENYRVLSFKHTNLTYYGLEDKPKPQGFITKLFKKPKCKMICFISTAPKGEFEEILEVYTIPEFQRKQFATKLIFFLKSYLQKSFLMGNVQGESGQTLVKSLSRTGRFTMMWLNIETGERHDYDFRTDNANSQPYRSRAEPTKWQILIEGNQIPLRDVFANPYCTTYFFNEND
jgi:hypothetical protein